ncbi:uncharacterized protein HMPREF1541_04632 [Cyphellophora europaea CBS 101466]|uniref:Phosphatidylinositol transfer protein SFH5 n=1 Tax=Cyphellophora europaea (strain CBS 101466) TaxID=1220924 RepID=W2RVL7_CYPE1|nr:uncharacterized protein HMPREF1541_04632 [Cyphellophora europaea CBS 101466]ETN40355.1 hypothetical protein HMPREF1541_04632 [Cyphellophora europaea CBS 101466]
MSAGEKPTTGAPNSTTGQAETAVVPENKEVASEPGPAAAVAVAATAQPSANGDTTPAAKPDETAAATETESKPPAAPIQQLWLLAKAHEYPEIWGVQLADPETHVPSQVVFQKFLNAYDGDLAKAKETLTKTLDWRKETKPLDLLSKAHAKGKFDGLGYVTSYGSETGEPESKEVFTWNIYGGVEDINNTFGDLPEFISWRVALMELALRELSISTATKPITAEYDPYKIYQVHDYKSISFFRQSPKVKSASTETIKVFAANYPELLKEKFFVNVPAIMGFVYGFMKMFVAAKTIKKFHPMSNSKIMVNEFGDSKVQSLGEQLPPDYGGKGDELPKVGKQPHLE